jgi:hypothetical protein
MMQAFVRHTFRSVVHGVSSLSTSKRLLSCALLVATSTAWSASAQTTDDRYVFRRIELNNKPFGYFASNTKWPAQDGDETKIFVCWENYDPHYAQEMAWVKEAIEASWQKYAKVSFAGWGRCPQTIWGIRIRMEDSGPHVKGLGTAANNRSDGMVLNFAFDQWSPSCKQSKELCIKEIATHEFGHALGFAHEQNRFDTPGECQQAPQGANGDVLLTPYDPDSIMNYCKEPWNGGKLSAWDIESIQKVYGSRTP